MRSTRTLQAHPCHHAEENRFFHGAHLERNCGRAENGSDENAVQWTEPDNCLVCLWPSKSRFYSWLQSKVARLVAQNGARLSKIFITLGVNVSPQSASVCRFGVFELDLRAAELRDAVRAGH